MISVRSIKLILGVVIAVFAMAAGDISIAIVKRQQALRDVSRYNIAWSASQAVNEVIRLEQRVAAFGYGEAGVDKDEVKLRLDIVANRVNLLRDGSMAALVEHDPDQGKVIEDLAATIARLDPLVASIDQKGVVAQILTMLKPFEARLGRFAAAANLFGGEQVAQDQQQLLQLHWVFSSLAGGLALCGLAMMALLFWQNRLLGRAHLELRAVTSDLRVAKEAAEAASEAKSRFLATMSHELRTPLNAIIGFSEIISVEAFGPIGSTQYREYAGDILRSGRHMFDLINDILTMAKLDSGHFELSPSPLQLRQVAQTCVDMFMGAEMAHGRDIAFDPGSHWAPLYADERAVRQMLLNLLSNAVKFSAADTPIRLSCASAPDGELWLSVSDCGIGMTEQEAELVVQPFHQVDSGLGRKYEGTGLGLSIVKALIENHGGRLVIESEPGKGSRISLVFPQKSLITETLGHVA